ncbi:MULTISPECIES: ABC transporter ATP-binding protein [Priestia]|uniref:ABC transporter ATP-binding protein n=1 Tax=Priestia TaxID=2800373 RepID=UPI00203D8B66|nr:MULTISPECIES: ABC transporter ATP-binding protein [Priestia]MCM3773622.1 ABC transporter ATP-binding protein [Priestia aryabhattai]MDY0942993.1 ABC transporter ATP-binding protein [Priestia megaterium]
MSLSIREVSKRYGEFTAVNELSLQIPKGEVFGFLGANGAGKTTTFRMILGLIEPTSGHIQWNDKSLTYSRSHLVGYLPEERGLYPKLKVKDQLVYLGRLRGMKKANVLQEMERWLSRFNIPQYASKKVEELSKGNQQKIQFIASVIHRPELLILDEPFSGLDPVNVEVLKEAVLDLKKRGTTIVFSSHRMEHVEELCEYLCIMHHGTPVVYGRLPEIKRSFGKKNVIVHGKGPFERITELEGVVKVKKTVEGMIVQIQHESVSQLIFQELKHFSFVSKFAVEEPSLNDIFIEKVGASYE